MASSARPDHRRVKIYRSYTIGEAAEVLGVHPNTVGNWMRKGLPSITPGGVQLILGADLKSHLQSKVQSRRQTCPPGSMFCFGCRTPRFPPPGLWEVANASGTTLNLSGICPECSNLMFRKVAGDGLVQAGFAEQNTQGRRHINDVACPSLNCAPSMDGLT
jgi:hypothetical protein